MKNITSFALLSAFASVAATAAVTDPVGYMTVPLPGTGGTKASELMFANQGLLPSGPDTADLAGTGVTFGSDGSGDYLEDSDGSWTAGDFVGLTGVSHALEITSGADHVGVFSFINSTTDTPARIYTADDLSAAGAGAGYRVWECYTPTTLFGASPDPSVLQSGDSPGSSDTVEIYNPVADSFELFYFRTAGKGANGWVASDSVTSRADYAIHPSDGLVIRRRQAADGALVISGVVKPGVTSANVFGDPTKSVFNFLANQVPVDQLTLDGTGLYTGDNATGVKGGADVGSSDELLVYDPVTNNFTTYFYKNAGKGAIGWVSTDDLSTEVGSTVLPSEVSLIVNRKSGVSFDWEIPAVTVSPGP